MGVLILPTRPAHEHTHTRTGPFQFIIKYTHKNGIGPIFVIRCGRKVVDIFSLPQNMKIELLREKKDIEIT